MPCRCTTGLAGSRPTSKNVPGRAKLIWNEITDDSFELPSGRARALVSYETSDERAATIEPVAVGDALPDMPLFLSNRLHIPASLESTGQARWAVTPQALREAVESGVLAEPEAN
ncbi:MAG: hypothetical protein GXY83_11315 [Rhodopirellula sp.]|nr:hypothetical protein [Rhodopirellula sp.]